MLVDQCSTSAVATLLKVFWHKADMAPMPPGAKGQGTDMSSSWGTAEGTCANTQTSYRQTVEASTSAERTDAWLHAATEENHTNGHIILWLLTAAVSLQD